MVAGIATILLGALAWWYLRDEPADHPGVNPSELALIKAAASASQAAEGDTARKIAPRSLAAILVGRMSWAMINFGLLTWGPSYLAQARGNGCRHQHRAQPRHRSLPSRCGGGESFLAPFLHVAASGLRLIVPPADMVLSSIGRS